jgi:neurotransmitter:Na+ symporter, NSS family
MQERENFQSRLGFILAAAGSAIGLGNLYQFPFKAGQGGGASFLILYLIFTVVICFPILLSEIAIGRKTQSNPAKAYSNLGFPKWNIVGLMGVICGALIFSFYILVAGWVLKFLVESIQGNLVYGKESFFTLIADPYETMLYASIFMLITAFFVSRGIKEGIEKIAKYVLPGIFIILIILIIYALTLPNAFEGIKFYLIPDFSLLLDMNTIQAALSQSFFSLSLGMGALITYGSYVSKKENILRASIWITLSDVTVAVLAGFLIFPLVFSQGIDPKSGGGLLFITMSEIFSSMGGLSAVILSTMFFLLLSLAALTTTISFLEVSVAYSIEKYDLNRKKAAYIVAAIILIIAIPSAMSHMKSGIFNSGFITYFNTEISVSFMDFIEDIASDFYLPLGGMLIVFFTSRVWKLVNFKEELTIKNKFDEKIVTLALFSLRYLILPVLLLLIILTVLNHFFGINLIN